MYKEYTYEIAGGIWDNGRPYKKIIIIHWSGRTADAKEIGRKSFILMQM